MPLTSTILTIPPEFHKYINDPMLNKPEQWFNLARSYYIGDEVRAQNFIFSHRCLEQAIRLDHKHSESLYHLGFLYYNGDGVRQSLPRAKEYFQKALEQENTDALVALLIMNNQKLNADHWYEIAQNYYSGTEGQIQNRAFARACYNQAIEQNSEHANSLYFLGRLYHEEVDIKDIDKAREYYQRAQAAGSVQAEIAILLLDNPDWNADQFYHIGRNYFSGQEGCTQNFAYAKAYFEQALLLNPEHTHSLYALGLLYEDDTGVTHDLHQAEKYFHSALLGGNYEIIVSIIEKDMFRRTAQEWYQAGQMYFNAGDKQNNLYILAQACFEQAIKLNPGYPEASIALRKILKLIEKEIILASQNPDEQDEMKKTALHRAAQNKHLKNCARLLVLRANKSIKDDDEKLPFNYLTPAEISRVNNLQLQLNELLTDLSTPTIKILVGRMISHRGLRRNDSQLSAHLHECYQKPEIKPLLDLVKLALLGLHNGSKRKKFQDDNYDSDNDDDEELKSDQRLRIQIDPKESHVDAIIHYDQDGQGVNGCYGVFYNNTVYVAGGSPVPDEAKATFFHELTHFTAQEVFNNNCNPYSQADTVNSDQFAQLATELEERQQTLDPLLQNAFSNNYKESKQEHAELIARTSEMMIAYPDGLVRLEQQAPALLLYYREVFLPAVENHRNLLESRALSNWPLNRLAASPHEPPFAFPERSESSAIIPRPAAPVSVAAQPPIVSYLFPSITSQRENYVRLGKVQMQSGQHEAARISFEKSVEIDRLIVKKGGRSDPECQKLLTTVNKLIELEKEKTSYLP